MRSQLLKANSKTLPRPKRRRQRLKSWPITFSPFARSLALALARKRHSQNPNRTLPAKEPQPSQSSHRHLDVRPLLSQSLCDSYKCKVSINIELLRLIGIMFVLFQGVHREDSSKPEHSESSDEDFDVIPLT